MPDVMNNCQVNYDIYCLKIILQVSNMYICIYMVFIFKTIIFKCSISANEEFNGGSNFPHTCENFKYLGSHANFRKAAFVFYLEKLILLNNNLNQGGHFLDLINRYFFAKHHRLL